ncbi:MAG: type II toxin-antitoxin system HicA family toxin [Candidatus Magasanikbacteria bacterium]|nr:type II toxin-antitoxin system HicA family toxin [Candidatus Magasanikbacteria bacterium]
MPKTSRLTSKQVIKLLKSEGFVLDHVSGSHYVFYHQIDGRRAVVPYHTKDLPIGTLKAILRSVGLE